MTNHKHFLRELAKFFSGLVVADFLVGVWVMSMKISTVAFLGIVFNSSMITAWMFCDIVLFVLLVHYGWRANIITPSITERSVFKIIGFLLGLVSFVHFLRIAFGVVIMIDSFQVPLWFSWVGLVVTAYLSYASFHFATVKNTKSKKRK